MQAPFNRCLFDIKIKKGANIYLLAPKGGVNWGCQLSLTIIIIHYINEKIKKDYKIFFMNDI